MKLTIYPGHPLRGEATLPGDKSLSHRAALLAALAEGTSEIDHFLVSGVTRPLLNTLSSLGVRWELNGTQLIVHGTGLHGFQSPELPLDCSNSATTLRLLAGGLAAAGTAGTLDGSPGLRSRPMERITAPLRQMGVAVEAAPGERAPLSIAARPRGSRLRAIEYSLPVASAQVKSCLLLAALDADGPVTLREPGPSRDHTERMLASMGAKVVQKGLSVTLEPLSAPLRPLCFTPPGDFSSAAFLIVAALITPGSEIAIREVGLNPTRAGLLDALGGMGADIRILSKKERSGEPTGDLIVRHSALHGTRVCGDLVVRMIDEFPAFAAAASFASGTSTVRDAAELRLKESDRIGALCGELRNLGMDVREAEDGFVINGCGSVPGGETAAHGDHRLAMALALMGLAAREPVKVSGAEILSESFPEFTETLIGLGAELRLEADQ